MRSLSDPFPRIILHLDMDAFFASVEQMDHPEWRGKPVIIGGETRGVVSTASYEARRFGVHSAMPMTTARRLCPQAIFVRGNRRRYVEISGRIMAALQDFSPLVEPASIDEAYLDATGLERLFGPVEQLIPAIKARVREVTGGLTCSVGAAPVKFLAKICSDINKPDGIYILRPDDVDSFLGGLDVRRLPGVGRRMVAELEALGIRRVEQLRRYGPELLEHRFGKWGRELHARARGIDPRPVVPEHEAKSESAETTFARDTRDREFLKTMLLGHAERVGASLRRHGLRGRTVTLKVKFADFRQITRSRTLPEATDSTSTRPVPPCWKPKPCPSRCGSSAWACPVSATPPPRSCCPACSVAYRAATPSRRPGAAVWTPPWTTCGANSANRPSSAAASSAHAMMARMIKMMF